MPMVWHTIVSAFRVRAAKGPAHTHLIGIGAIRQSTGTTLSWTASDLAYYAAARFVDGTSPAKTVVKVSRGQCEVCGEEVICLSPPEVERRLPEARTSNPKRQPAGRQLAESRPAGSGSGSNPDTAVAMTPTRRL
jgi:hypothetical protein